MQLKSAVSGLKPTPPPLEKLITVRFGNLSANIFCVMEPRKVPSMYISLMDVGILSKMVPVATPPL